MRFFLQRVRFKARTPSGFAGWGVFHFKPTPSPRSTDPAKPLSGRFSSTQVTGFAAPAADGISALVTQHMSPALARC